MGEWSTKSWNVCKTRTCRGPVEGPGGSVEFFDGSEAHCIECGREYMVSIGGEGWEPSLVTVPRRRAVSGIPGRLRAKEQEARTMNVTSMQWGVKCRKGDKEWWYGGTSPAMGTEAEARDKAARRNDNDSDGTIYRAERIHGSGDALTFDRSAPAEQELLRRVNECDASDCTCHFRCGEDSASGKWHQHEDDPCPLHPDAPMVG